MDAAANFLEISRKMFVYYKSLADKSMAVLNEDEIHYQPNEESNSIAILVKHMSGNMLSRFTDFLTTDGEKEWRNRDGEFEAAFKTKQDMLDAWEQGWACVFKALDAVSDDKVIDIVYIRNEGHTVLEAVTRQLAHYASHAGQIIYLAKMIRNTNWKTLSIPRGGSSAFNQDKFNQEKDRTFFTDKM
jgi:hypothetical protein